LANIIVSFGNIDNARQINGLLARSGFNVIGLCTTGTQTIAMIDDLNDGIIVSGYKLGDMIYSELLDMLPDGFEMLLMASQTVIDECEGSHVVGISMPLKVSDLIDAVNVMSDIQDRRRRREKLHPKARSEEDTELILKAKELVMKCEHMTEDEAHRYMQKRSMDNSTGLVETAQMIMSLYAGNK